MFLVRSRGHFPIKDIKLKEKALSNPFPPNMVWFLFSAFYSIAAKQKRKKELIISLLFHPFLSFCPTFLPPLCCFKSSILHWWISTPERLATGNSSNGGRITSPTAHPHQHQRTWKHKHTQISINVCINKVHYTYRLQLITHTSLTRHTHMLDTHTHTHTNLIIHILTPISNCRTPCHIMNKTRPQFPLRRLSNISPDGTVGNRVHCRLHVCV